MPAWKCIACLDYHKSYHFQGSSNSRSLLDDCSGGSEFKIKVLSEASFPYSLSSWLANGSLLAFLSYGLSAVCIRHWHHPVPHFLFRSAVRLIGTLSPNIAPFWGEALAYGWNGEWPNSAHNKTCEVWDPVDMSEKVSLDGTQGRSQHWRWEAHHTEASVWAEVRRDEISLRLQRKTIRR